MLEKICFPQVGRESLDREHKDIIFFLHQVKGSDNPLKVARTFIEYFVHHCEHEEEFMRELQYPRSDYEDHRLQHQRMKEFFTDTMIELAVGEPGDIKEILEESRLNIIKHINTYDAKLVDWVTKAIG
jgi:hemerythrin-like metal-binding protein